MVEIISKVYTLQYWQWYDGLTQTQCLKPLNFLFLLCIFCGFLQLARLLLYAFRSFRHVDFFLSISGRPYYPVRSQEKDELDCNTTEHRKSGKQISHLEYHHELKHKTSERRSIVSLATQLHHAHYDASCQSNSNKNLPRQSYQLSTKNIQAFLEDIFSNLVYVFLVVVFSIQSFAISLSYYQTAFRVSGAWDLHRERYRIDVKQKNRQEFSRWLLSMINDVRTCLKNQNWCGSLLSHIRIYCERLTKSNIHRDFPSLLSPKSDLYLFVYNRIAIQTSSLICRTLAVTSGAGTFAFSNYNIGGA